METTPVQCSAQLVSNGALPAVTDGTCAESSRTFNVAKNDDGSLLLTVSQPVTPSSDQKGYHTIAADEVVLEQTGASSQERYVGPAEFGLLSS
ncbi:hypothetical protein K458DRAFT_421499 [Lentithecium fluviatile CBS 122367]|uniref:Uncharacterized protein n=1 Tax=Lentithecium fluviatile CBS 122367 TaxID=1168545 RepID=A0A6G1IQK8_9PLEO|nr:hypothetical protein K458DRAFT_421499 [Lentithecium fluviatile CBS 122367]